MALLPWQREKIAYWFSLRLTIRAIAKKLGLSKNTVQKERKRIVEVGLEPLCRCGRKGSHKGICQARRKERKVISVSVKSKEKPKLKMKETLSESEMIAAFIATHGVTKLAPAGREEWIKR